MCSDKSVHTSSQNSTVPTATDVHKLNVSPAENVCLLPSALSVASSLVNDQIISSSTRSVAREECAGATTRATASDQVVHEEKREESTATTRTVRDHLSAQSSDEAPAALHAAAGAALTEARYVFERLRAADVVGDFIKVPAEIASDPIMRGIVAEENASPSSDDSEVPSVGTSPSLSASVFGVTGRALADTGAEVNLICVRFLLSALKEANINPLTAGYSSSPPRASSFWNNYAACFGIVTGLDSN